MRFLRSNTAVMVTVGPFYDKTDGVTIETGLTITNERITLTADTDAGSAPTNILDNVTGATSGTSNDLNYITGNDAGMMQLELAAADVNRVGRMFLSITDAANHVPVFHEFFVLPAAIFDWLTGVIVPLPANVTQLLGTAWLAPGTAGTPDVNVKLWNALTTVELPLVPTTAGRKLDVSAGGEAGVDWANVGSPTTAVDLSGTTIKTTQKVDVDTIKTNPVVNGGTITFPTTATLASTTNITAGTIATATNVTTVNGLAAGVITAASIASAALASAKFANDTGLGSIRSNTAQAGAGTTITLDASASAVDDFYKNDLIYLVSGTGVGQARFISGYNGTTKVATVPTWATNPDNTSVFTILPFGAIAGASAPTAAEVADAVWDEAAAGHVDAGSFGKLAADVLEDTGTTLQAEVDGIQADTEDIQARLPAALVGGRIDANVGAISADATAADNAEAFFDGTGYAGTNNVIPLVTTTSTVTTVSGLGVGAIAANSFAAGAIDAAAIAANAIGASELADGAIDAATFAASAIDATAIASSAITAAKIASDALTDAKFDSAGKLRSHFTAVLKGITAAGGSTTTIVLNALTGIDGGVPSATDDFYNGRVVVFTSGALAGQATSISDYVGATQTLTVVALTGAPAAAVTLVIV